MMHQDPYPPALTTLLTSLRACAEAEAIRWLEEGVALVGRIQDKEDQLATRFTMARRRLGADRLTDPAQPLATSCGELPLDAWSRGDAARACLLLAAIGDGEPEWDRVVTRLFRHGDESERASLVRSLCLLPEPCRLLPVAQEAGRVNSLALYAALALGNPYPAACYDDRAFNQVVLKSLFTGLPVGRILGLAERANPELSRICEDYRDERVAAGRTVPPDIWLALEPHATPRGLELMLEALNDDDIEHRYNAATALRRRKGEPSIARALTERLGRETDPGLRRLLELDAAGTDRRSL
jgi:hypothetical protein